MAPCNVYAESLTEGLETTGLWPRLVRGPSPHQPRQISIWLLVRFALVRTDLGQFSNKC
jgi:hypothetical protein